MNHRYTDPWAWGRAAGVEWWPAATDDPRITDREIDDLMASQPSTIAIVRYDPDRPMLSLAAHCAIAVSPVLRVSPWDITRHVQLPFDAIWNALTEVIAAQGDSAAIAALPHPVWSQRTYHAWMLRDFEAILGLPRGSLAAASARGDRRSLAAWIHEIQRAHVIPRAH
jgi:hypothetical protein